MWLNFQEVLGVTQVLVLNWGYAGLGKMGQPQVLVSGFSFAVPCWDSTFSSHRQIPPVPIDTQGREALRTFHPQDALAKDCAAKDEVRFRLVDGLSWERSPVTCSFAQNSLPEFMNFKLFGVGPFSW